MNDLTNSGEEVVRSKNSRDSERSRLSSQASIRLIQASQPRTIADTPPLSTSSTSLATPKIMTQRPDTASRHRTRNLSHPRPCATALQPPSYPHSYPQASFNPPSLPQTFRPPHLLAPMIHYCPTATPTQKQQAKDDQRQDLDSRRRFALACLWRAHS